MNKEKWIGSWSFVDEERGDSRQIEGEFNFGIIPSVLVFGLLAYGLFKLIF
ncbi:MULTISPECIES: hypothetical protein [Aerococcus]|uniref:hypothetical protein n=1 Tax=Aerococcus TaxID=1375 RepID=UPI0015EBBEF9|nr:MULTISPECIES: hypothetical protein [Aerococcus]MDK6688928.1 hypothetical protein [Aerococcus urinae]MDK8133803.1 hypothetical protein [Aerococcus urinae]MDK8485545.1 hypothetical protein [Aerococcus urinae]MDL5179074.1 hypothetical protein [Aerococcus tenax]MDL5207973.1 hypothetical protein [Aerococcus tenax]